MSESVSAIAEPRLGPVLLVLVSAIFWGLWWVPVRLTEALGLGGVWPNLLINAGALLGLGALAFFSRSSAKLTRPALIGCTLIGMAVALYGASLSLTDVARAVLLFYLAPAWSTLIEVTFLGQRWQWRRLFPLLLSFGGLIAVFRGEIAFGDGGVGDLAALASGIAWSAGAAMIFSSGDEARRDDAGTIPLLSFVVMIAAVAVSLALLPLNWQGWPTVGSGDALLAMMLAMAAGIVYLAPIIGVTLWGATRLLPTTISFLLAAEILSGITSSALFLDEPFGRWEVAGTIMIVTSVVLHVATSGEASPKAGAP